MSVAMTQQQVIDRTKTATRRKGWWLDKHGRHLVKPGDHLILVDRLRGLKKGERATVLTEVEVVSTCREHLDNLTTFPSYGEEEVRREGFPGIVEFIDRDRFFVKAQGMQPSDLVTRIEWRYLDDEVSE
jgi:hypothetical protein